MRVGLALLALLLLPTLLPTGGAQLPPGLDPILGPGAREGANRTRAVVGPEFTREEVDVRLDMDFRTVDFDTVNVIFGGGTFQAQARIHARIDMRVISGSRVQSAAGDVLPGAENLSLYGYDARSSFIPADAFRATFSGQVLEAFKEEQEKRVADFLVRTVPNVTVLSTSFSWTNISPADSYRGEEVPLDPEAAHRPDLTEPPITLLARIDVEYIERTSLLTIVERALARDESKSERREEVADAAAAYDRSAFGLLGITQVLDLRTFPGWNLEVTVRLPEGYTFEEASPDVVLAPSFREAQAVTLGREANADVTNPVALTLSNRFIVCSAMLGAMLLAGALVRFPVLLTANWLRRRGARR